MSLGPSTLLYIQLLNLSHGDNGAPEGRGRAVRTQGPYVVKASALNIVMDEIFKDWQGPG